MQGKSVVLHEVSEESENTTLNVLRYNDEEEW
jgi:hypothetical protein